MKMNTKILKMKNGRKVEVRNIRITNEEVRATLATEIFNELRLGFDFLLNIGGKEISFVRPLPLKVITAFVR